VKIVDVFLFEGVISLNESNQGLQFTPVKSWNVFHGPNDPCPPIGTKYYSTPPHLYLGFQPPGLEQFSYKEALKKGTLWKVFYDFYENPYKPRRD
jgi:spore coat protein JA